jgi:hypothetical protein
MRIEHILPDHLITRKPVRVLVVGAGASGSAIAMGLPYLHQAMRVWGHPYGLAVTLMDGDTVSDTNCVRQPSPGPTSARTKRRSLSTVLTCSGALRGARSQPVSVSAAFTVTITACRMS